MKNLKKLSRNEMVSITGGGDDCGRNCGLCCKCGTGDSMCVENNQQCWDYCDSRRDLLKNPKQ